MSFIREIVKNKKDNSEIVTSNEDFIPTPASPAIVETTLGIVDFQTASNAVEKTVSGKRQKYKLLMVASELLSMAWNMVHVELREHFRKSSLI